MYKKILVIVFSSIVSISGYAQSLENKLDELLNERYPSTGPGATALLAMDGKIVYHKAFGKANLELNIPMQTDMVFQIASISKQFTAISILMLVEKGKIDLDDDITKYIEDYPTDDKHISIKHLLTHTSGISRSITQKPWDANIRKHDFDIPSWIDYFKDEPKAFEPGEAFQYNNFGYVILGHIVEIVAGMSYGDFVEKNIFQPLGMHNSSQTNDSDIIKNRAYGYEKYDGYVNKQYTSLSRSIGAGSLMSTVEDLYIWNRALVENSLITEESLNLAFNNYSLKNGQKINYGFGWFINEINGSPTVEHAGGDHGFRTDAIYLPQEDLFVAIFSNCSCGEPRPLSTKITALAINKPFDEPTIVDTDVENIYKWVGKYTFSDGSSRNVILKDSQLYWVLANGTEIAMSATSDKNFVLENGMTQIGFNLVNDTLIEVRVKNRISVKNASKPYTKRNEISLPKETTVKYVGRYKLFPEFDITIAWDNGQLTAAGTGQEPSNLFPESSTRFFFKSIDGFIDFILDRQGESTALEITQNGVTYSGNKVD